ncbi:MAG: YbaB/EbfC family nucleoid-associated protein [Anaeroplasmataceae bacterium]|nr:YbaB/EbfC family nucleoid-associated protein [Anaeroplasmataceae bacterium]
MNQQAMMRLKKMQKQMMEAQEKLEQTVFTGTAGGGMVEVSVKGTHEVVGVKIDPEALESKDDIEMIEDTIVAALNDAHKKIEAESQKALGGFGGAGFGGLF